MTEITNILPPFQNKSVVVKQNQNTKDIMRLIDKKHNENKKDYDKIAKMFWKGDAKKTAICLFNFIRQNVQYKEESKSAQTVKTPSAILATAKGDCKHYASFIVGVADALNRMGYPISGGYMYVNEEDKSANFHHVFAVITDTETKRKYWVDPIPTKNFNSRKKYLSAKYIPMALMEISGEVGKRKKLTKAERKKKRQENRERRRANKRARIAERKRRRQLTPAQRKAERKARREGNREAKRNASGAQKASHVILRVPNAMSRNAFLGLLKINAFRMSSKIGEKLAQDPNFRKRLQAEWHGAGGKWNKLRHALNQGINVHNRKFENQLKQIGANGVPALDYDPLTGLYKLADWEEKICNCESLSEMENKLDEGESINGSGLETAATVVALVGAALPIIMRLAGLLKGAGVDTDEVIDSGEEATDEIYEQANDAEDYPLEDNELSEWGQSNTPQFAIKKTEKADGTATIQYTKSNLDDNGNVKWSGSNLDINQVFERVKDFAEENKTILLTGGAVALIYNMTKKKKRRRR